MSIVASPPDIWSLSGFGDEIDPDPRVQCAVLLAVGARHIEVRSAWGVNVVDLSDAQVQELASIILGAGLRVSAVASPIGKCEITDPREEGRLARVIEVARALGAPFIRVFSFWTHGDPAAISREVFRRMRDWAAMAESAGLVLVHENEKDIYGDVPERVLEIVEMVDSPALKLAWDSANFVQVGVRPHTDAFDMLAQHIAYLQVKDARIVDRAIVPAGEGDGELADTIAALRSRGYAGFASLEPHLADAHALGGFSGAAGFGAAARAFRTLTDASGVALQ